MVPEMVALEPQRVDRYMPMHILALLVYHPEYRRERPAPRVDDIDASDEVCWVKVEQTVENSAISTGLKVPDDLADDLWEVEGIGIA